MASEAEPFAGDCPSTKEAQNHKAIEMLSRPRSSISQTAKEDHWILHPTCDRLS